MYIVFLTSKLIKESLHLQCLYKLVFSFSKYFTFFFLTSGFIIFSSYICSTTFVYALTIYYQLINSLTNYTAISIDQQYHDLSL